MKLVIVESPTKSKTIKKFLGSDYEVEASYGHVRDLPKTKLGVDVDNNFEPHYVIPRKSRSVIKDLKKKKKEAEEIILAMDKDREGESIAYHLKEILKLDKPQRIHFQEITEEAVQEALKNPHEIDQKLVDAQQARRVLDRLVGYKLSPFLWKKLFRNLSAGRVQSVALNLIVEKEKEREAFTPRKYWTIKGFLEKDSQKLEAKLKKIKSKNLKKFTIKSLAEAKEIKENLQNQEAIVEKVKEKESKKYPYAPFRTSSLQQEAGSKLRYSSGLTMSAAQKLYELGLISYHRTDSVRLSKQSLQQARDYIKDELGNKYWAGSFKKYKTKSKTDQQAHEAIRPTHINQTPAQLKKKLSKRNWRLYQLIWQRTVASQMSPAILNKIRIDFKAGNYSLRSSGQTIKFDGFTKIYPTELSETELPKLEKGSPFNIEKVEVNEHSTKPPARYSEATLVKKLKDLEIGRPSTYSPIISTIKRRNYVQKDKNNRLYPTRTGRLVDELISEHFPNVVNPKFTAEMEQNLDEVARGEKDWQKIIKDFYEPFIKNLEKKYDEVPKKDLTEKTDRKCPKCDSPLVKKMGRFGQFLACSNFPKCKYTEALPEKKTGVTCPKCGKGEMIEKRNRRGQIFYACSNFPKCKFTLSGRPTGEKCPQCDSLLIKTKSDKVKCSNKKCSYKK